MPTLLAPLCIVRCVSGIQLGMYSESAFDDTVVVLKKLTGLVDMPRDHKCGVILRSALTRPQQFSSVLCHG